MATAKKVIYVISLFIVLSWLVILMTDDIEEMFIIVSIPLTILVIFLWQKIDKKYFTK